LSTISMWFATPTGSLIWVQKAAHWYGSRRRQ